jgi:hypothetical protein
MVILLWLTSMGWIVKTDILPAWSANDVPRLSVDEWISVERRQTQAGVYDSRGRMGTAWSMIRVDVVPFTGQNAAAAETTTIQRNDVIHLDRLSIPSLEDAAPLRVFVDSLFNQQGRLDEFTLRVLGDMVSLRVHGERFHADFSFEITNNDRPVQTFKVPLTDAGMISDAFKPFSQMTGDLHVGQTWRMQVINPLAVLTGIGPRFNTLLVQVTGEESITTSEGTYLCRRIEAENVKAWIDDTGYARRQEMVLPVGGTIRIESEPFDQDTYDTITRHGAAPPRGADRS